MTFIIISIALYRFVEESVDPPPALSVLTMFQSECVFMVELKITNIPIVFPRVTSSSDRKIYEMQSPCDICHDPINRRT